MIFKSRLIICSLEGGEVASTAARLKVDHVSNVAKVFVRGNTVIAITDNGQVWSWSVFVSLPSPVPSDAKYEDVLAMHDEIVVLRRLDSSTTLPLPRRELNFDPPFISELSFRIVNVQDDVHRDLSVHVMNEIVGVEITVPKYYCNEQVLFNVGSSTFEPVNIPTSERPCSFVAEVGPIKGGNKSEIFPSMLTLHPAPECLPVYSLLFPEVDLKELDASEYEIKVLNPVVRMQDDLWIVFVMRRIDHDFFFQLKQGTRVCREERFDRGKHKSSTYVFKFSLLTLGEGEYELWLVKKEYEKPFFFVSNIAVVKRKVTLEEHNQSAVELFHRVSEFRSFWLEKFELTVEGFVFVDHGVATVDTLTLYLDGSQLDAASREKIRASNLSAQIELQRSLDPTSNIYPAFAQLSAYLEERSPVSWYNMPFSPGELDDHIYVTLTDPYTELVFKKAVVPVYKDADKARKYFEDKGLPLPVTFKRKDELQNFGFRCWLKDPDIYYVYPLQQLPVHFEMNLNDGNQCHLIYGFPKGVWSLICLFVCL